MSSSNLPNKLRDIPVFIGNPWVRVINLLDDVVIIEPVTAEVWFAGVNQPSIVVTPVVEDQTITVTLTPEQIALLPSRKASINIKFGSQYVFQQTLTPTYEGAVPEDVVEEYDTPGLGVFRVSYFSDITNARLAIDNANIALDAAERAEKAASSAVAMYYQWGTWNVATNTPTLAANPTTLVVDGKYPYVVITTPGNLPIGTVQDYALGQAIDQGFLYGQPTGKWAYVSADSAANQQFQKNHAKFQIGPADNIDITQNDVDVTVEITGTVTVFDEIFGYRVIQPTTITVANNQVLVLSGSPSLYASPGLQTKGVGEEIYLRTVTFNTLSNPLDGLAEIGAVQQFRWSPKFPTLQSMLFEKNNSRFDIGPPANIQITEGGTSTTITIIGGVTVRDDLSGYKNITAGQTITIGNNETAVLSASSSSYVDPKLYKRGNGEPLYLYKYGLLSLSRPLKGLAALGNVSNFKWTTKWAFMTDKTPVTSLQTRATNLEAFQVRRAEAYLGERNKVKISSQDGGTIYKVEILSSMSIRDEKSGYWAIPAQTINITNNQVLCLAANAYPAAYVDPGFSTKGTGGTVNLYKYGLNELSNKFTGTIVLGNLVNGVWNGQHPSFMGDYIDDLTDLRQKGLVPAMVSSRSPYVDQMPNLTAWMHLKNKDFVALVTNGSIYDNIYCTKRPNPEYRTPRSDDFSVPTYIEDEWMKTIPQKFRGIGAKIEIGAPDDVFAESGMTTATTKFYDPDWDLVFASPPAQTSQGLKTRVLEGGTPVLSFSFRNGEESLHFVNRVAGLNSGHVGIGIEGGNGFIQVLHETWDATTSTGTWQEANGYDWQQHKNSGTTHPAWGVATGLKESIAQHRLKFRRNPANADRLNRVITMTATDGGRICYHGISYSTLRHQLIFINDCKGSHGINELKAYDAWRLRYYKPNFIIFGANTINMLPSYTAGYSPDTFSQDFVDFVNYLKAETYTRSQVGTNGYVDGPYSPEIMMCIDFCSRTQALYDTIDRTPTNTFTGYGPATLLDFITKLEYRVRTECNIPVSNAFPVHQEVVAKYSAFTGDTKYRASHQYTGAKSASQTVDTTHLGDKGAYTSATVHVPALTVVR
jgi:hypothetical protein